MILEIAVQQESAFWGRLQSCKHFRNLACVNKAVRAALPPASRCVELMLPKIMISMSGLWRLVGLSRNQLRACSRLHGRFYTMWGQTPLHGIPFHLGIRAAEESPHGGLRQLMRAQLLERQAHAEQRSLARAYRQAWLETWLSRKPNLGFYVQKLRTGPIPLWQHELRRRHFLDNHVDFELAVQEMQRDFPSSTYKHVVEERVCHKLWMKLTKCGKHHWNHVARMGGGVLAGSFGLPKTCSDGPAAYT